jgi:hypothetical protein
MLFDLEPEPITSRTDVISAQDGSTKLPHVRSSPLHPWLTGTCQANG